MPNKETLLKSIQHYMRNDGVEAANLGGCNNGWMTLHTVPAFYHVGTFTKEDVIPLIAEAINRFGYCPQSDTFNRLKQLFPDLFAK